MKKIIITSIRQLKELSRDKQIDIAIVLNGGLKSCKSIDWDPRKKKFNIFNGIDGSYMSLTEEQIVSQEWTNIGKAIKLKALILQ